MARLVAAPRRYPGCRAERTSDHGWLIRLDGAGEDVIPRGVTRSGGDDAAVLLDSSVGDAYQNLDRVSRIEDDESAAESLAEHARTYPISRLLCHHGLPMWHRGPDPCRMLMTAEGVPSITLSHARTMMSGLRGLEDLAHHIATRNRPARPVQVAAALRWRILPDYIANPARAETERDGGLFLGRCQQIVTSSVRHLRDGSLLRRDLGWTEDLQPQMVAHAGTDLGLYVSAFTTRLLGSAGAP